MSVSEGNSSEGIDKEESFLDFREAELSPTEAENSSTPVQETIGTPDTSTVVPVPEITEDNLDTVPSLAKRLLEELFEAGHISGAKLAYLEAKYDSMNRVLKSQAERERHQQTIADFYNEENQKIQAQMRRVEYDLSSDESEEVIRLRKKLLSARNKVSLSEDRTVQLQQHIERMKEKKDGLDVEYTQMYQAQDDTKQVLDLNDVCANLRKEIIQQRLDIESLKDVLQDSKRNVAAKKSVVLELEGQEKLLMVDAVAASGIPRDLARECERLLRHQSEQKKLLAEADAQLSETNTQVAKARQQLNELASEKRNSQNNLSQLKNEQFTVEKKVADLAKRYEEARDEDIFQAETRATLLMTMEHVQAEKRTTRRMNFQIASEIDQNLKQVRLEEKHINVVQEMCLPLIELLRKLNRQLTSMPGRKLHIEKKKALQEEIEKHITTLSKQENLSIETKMQYDEILGVKKKLQSEVDTQCRQLHELVQKTTALNKSIEGKSLKIREALVKCKRLKATIDSKEFQVEDMKKILQNTIQKTVDFQRLTEIIKVQRVQLWRLAEATRHKVHEMKERKRILAAEIKVLVERAASIIRYLEKEQSKVLIETDDYHRLRSRIISHRLQHTQMADKIKEKEFFIESLSLTVDHWAKELIELNSRYKSAVRSRNQRGIELAERNEEMCQLHEIINVQAKAIDEAELALRRKVDEVASIQVELVDARRSHEVTQRVIPKCDWYVREIYKLSEELCEARKKLVQLEEEFGNTRNGARVRFLKGTDADPKHMKMKQEYFEIRLTKKEVQLKEKQLILRGLDQLIDCTKKKLSSGEVEALCVASHVNQLQRNLKKTNRQMMASVAELSIYRSEKLSLSRAMGDQMRLLQEYQSFSGLSCEEADDHHQCRPRSSAEDCDKAQPIMDAEAVSLERHLVVSKEIQSWNQRPNAYLSDPMEPCLPRPYGAYAPFMPPKSAPSMRYYCKPTQSNS